MIVVEFNTVTLVAHCVPNQTVAFGWKSVPVIVTAVPPAAGPEVGEIEPTLAVLRQCVLDLEADRQTPKEVRARIKGMLGFLTDLTTWFDQMVQLPRATLTALLKVGAKVGSLVAKSTKEG